VLKLKSLIDVNIFFTKTLLDHGKALRQPQAELSQDIQYAYSNKLKFIAEAEVGIGKSVNMFLKQKCSF
jgi:Rad3-related DNA helicase